MSEERVDRIDARLERLEQGQEALHVDVNGLRTDMDGLRTDVNDLRADVAGVGAGQNSLRTEVSDLRRHMGVLHEEVLDRIKALAFDPTPLRREFQAGDALLREELTQRIEPLEAALRRTRRRR